MDKEEGSDKEPFSVPPSIPLLLLFISYLFLKKFIVEILFYQNNFLEIGWLLLQ